MTIPRSARGVFCVLVITIPTLAAFFIPPFPSKRQFIEKLDTLNERAGEQVIVLEARDRKGHLTRLHVAYWDMEEGASQFENWGWGSGHHSLTIADDNQRSLQGPLARQVAAKCNLPPSTERLPPDYVEVFPCAAIPAIQNVLVATMARNLDEQGKCEPGDDICNQAALEQGFPRVIERLSTLTSGHDSWLLPPLLTGSQRLPLARFLFPVSQYTG
jgi:hypothetical protein